MTRVQLLLTILVATVICVFTIGPRISGIPLGVQLLIATGSVGTLTLVGISLVNAVGGRGKK